MAPKEKKPLRDWVYLIIVGTQLFGILAMDLAPFYPKFLWESPSAPLHFLIALRESYVHSSGDPFFSHAGRQQPAWFRASLYIEFAFQLPLAMYLVFQLVSRRAISGTTELAGLAFGCLTGMGSILCCAELYHLGPEVLSEEKKSNLLYGTYLPFAVIPTLMAMDMFLRLLPRVQAPAKAKAL